MRIGIDIDGVMVDSITYVANEMRQGLDRSVTPHIVAHEIETIEGLDDFMETHGDRMFSAQPPYEAAVDAINKLSEDHEVYVITARFHRHHQATLAWMDKYGIRYDEIIFTEGQTKVNICRDKGIELFVEDSVVNAAELADEGIRVIMYATDYNGSFDREDVVRCDSWQAIMEMISD